MAAAQNMVEKHYWAHTTAQKQKGRDNGCLKSF
jgi:hypothetical protein